MPTPNSRPESSLCALPNGRGQPKMWRTERPRQGEFRRRDLTFVLGQLTNHDQAALMLTCRPDDLGIVLCFWPLTHCRAQENLVKGDTPADRGALGNLHDFPPDNRAAAFALHFGRPHIDAGLREKEVEEPKQRHTRSPCTWCADRVGRLFIRRRCLTYPRIDPSIQAQPPPTLIILLQNTFGIALPAAACSLFRVVAALRVVLVACVRVSRY